MTITVILAMALAGFGWAVIAGRLAGTSITGPLVMTLCGLLIFLLPTGVHLAGAQTHQIEEIIHVVAEITLIVVLFSDASHISSTRLKQDWALPARLLLISLPIMIVLGAAIAMWLFPSLGMAGALLLAAILAPTDAALGQSVVSNKAVPEHIRIGLEVESGLNDGIALFIVLIALCMLGWTHDIDSASGWVVFGVKQIGVGSVAGIAVGWLGARVVAWADRNACLADAMRGAAGLALAAIAWAVAELLSGNGFISAFVAGFIYGQQSHLKNTRLSEFLSSEGQLLIYGTFLLFGYALLPEALSHFTLEAVLYAAISLLLLRMIAVALSTVGLTLNLSATLFVGWFGPRGLASVVFALFAVQAVTGEHNAVVREVAAIVYITVAMSVLLHGLSAAPLSRLFAKKHSKQDKKTAMEKLP